MRATKEIQVLRVLTIVRSTFSVIITLFSFFVKSCFCRRLLRTVNVCSIVPSASAVVFQMRTVDIVSGIACTHYVFRVPHGPSSFYTVESQYSVSNAYERLFCISY